MARVTPHSRIQETLPPAVVRCRKQCIFSEEGRGTGLFFPKLVVVASVFAQIFGPASWWEIQSYLLVLQVRQEHLWQGQPRVLPMSSVQGTLVPLGSLSTSRSQPSLPAEGGSRRGPWALPELPLVMDISGLIQAAPPKIGFLFWVGKKNHFWMPEPGNPFLLSNLVRAFLTELLPPLILQETKGPEQAFLEHVESWKIFIGNNGVFGL